MAESKIRLLICEHCGSVEEMPAYEGYWKHDTWLNEKLKGHLLPSGEKTHGNVHVGFVEAAKWRRNSKDIIQEMAKEFTLPGEGAGLGQTFYDVKDNYMEDAMKCWRVDHGRTLDCADYMSEGKRLYPDTKADRKSEGMSSGKDRPSTFLCQFCPVHSIVEGKKNKVKNL
jgi:hypothetical protein